MGRGWTRGFTSQKRDKLVELLSITRIAVIFGGSEDRQQRIPQHLWNEKISQKHMKNITALSPDYVRVYLTPAAQFNLQSCQCLTDSICH